MIHGARGVPRVSTSAAGTTLRASAHHADWRGPAAPLIVLLPLGTPGEPRA